MGVESVSAKPRDMHLSAKIFVQDFASVAGRRGAFAAALILLAAAFESASISLLVPLLGLIFGTASMPAWLRDGAAALFALTGAHSLFFRLSLLLGIFGVLVLLRAIAIAARDIAIFDLQFHFVETQQLRTAESLAAAKWDYLARFQHARLTHLMSGDMQRLGQGTQFVLLGATASVMVAAQWILAFLLAPALAAVLLVAMIVGSITFGPMMARARALGGHVEDASLSLLNSTTQFLGGLKLAISQNLQKRYVDETGAILRQLRKHQVHFLRQRVTSQAAITLLFGLFGAAAVMVSLLAIKVPPSLLVALLLIVTRMTAPMGQIQQAAQQFARLLAVYDTIRELQSELLHFARDDATYDEGAFPEGRIVFERVSFLHARRNGLRGVDLVVEPGECLAVTGISGSGKTTFADLLVGLCSPQSGRITAGGLALEGATLMAWRRSLAYVSQDSFLFHDTIRNNLGWANPNASEEEMWQALTQIGAGELVRRADGGFDAVVGERGTLVSGGERQRIALARAILRRPRLLVLDEATSALDAAGEREVLEGLRTIRPRPTIVLIAHRTENLSLCDRIVRIERGRLVEPQPA